MERAIWNLKICLDIRCVHPTICIRSEISRLDFGSSAPQTCRYPLACQCSYAIIGSIADRGTSTCNAPYESGSIAPWSKKNRIPSLSTAKFW